MSAASATGGPDVTEPRAPAGGAAAADRFGGPAPALGFLFDANRCTGCAACVLACSIENGLGWARSWRQIVPFNPERRPGLPSFHLSLACNHCADAPCVAHCPTGAMRRDPVTAAVVVDDARCIGCRYCAWVCPYDAPRFDEERGVMRKCTLCGDRLRGGGTPACVDACPTDALGFGALAGVPRIPGFPDASVGPRISFTPLRGGSTLPESSWRLPDDVLAAYAPDAFAVAVPGGGLRAATRGEAPAISSTSDTARRVQPWPANTISFRSEAPLWVFTSGLAGLVGWIGAGAWGVARVPLSVFLALAAAILALSTLHLGRPLGAWHALANVGTSALSREIAACGAFLGVATLWLAWGGGGGVSVLPAAPGDALLTSLGGAATALGVLALAAVDRVYRPVRAGAGLDAADTILTGPLVAAAIARSPWLFAAFAASKLALRLRDAARAWTGRRPARPPAAALHLSAFAGPLALWTLLPGAWPGWAMLLVAASELVDRARFYRELAIPGPRRTAREEAAASVSRRRRHLGPRTGA